MIDIGLLTNRELVNLLHEADAELLRRIAEGDSLANRVDFWYASLKRTNTTLGRSITKLEREAIGRNRMGGIG
jgi:hypothetical protein